LTLATSAASVRRLRERADELGIDVEVLDHPRPY
jgi:hypothetical protein